jgi:hypothetical protein
MKQISEQYFSARLISSSEQGLIQFIYISYSIQLANTAQQSPNKKLC